ncbi:hypothetical protein GHNINEIG_00592 [Hydrogenovibrio crunogenus]|uniref:DUF3185 family protein n=1 Tax=Hydrogenovibrio crunogenus TaxID=39765 RepID=A0A4P7NXQ5_9GAMM|nr:DUF3185 family protein [Hydrogenovibrio crunogenus]QBZ82560.1 hypothetical protein GHNINEIG_00592 [Hydrogenovibrio crunogenus]
MSRNLLSFILIGLGILLLIWGIQASDSFSSQVSEVFTGTSSDKAMSLMIVGMVSLIAGFYLRFRN